MYLKVDIPEHFQFRIVRSLKDMLLRKETEIHYIGGAEVLPPPLPAKEEMENYHACFRNSGREDT